MWLLVKAPFVAVITLTISKSKIFKPFREWLASRQPFLGALVSCPYCLLHWTAVVVITDGPGKMFLYRWGWMILVAAVLMALIKRSIDHVN